MRTLAVRRHPASQVDRDRLRRNPPFCAHQTCPSDRFTDNDGSFRFLVEFTREPNSFLGLLSFGMWLGQSLPMILAGIAMLAVANCKPAAGAVATARVE